MDELLQTAWRERRPPFSGHTIFLPRAVPVDDLLPLLRRIVSVLEARYPRVRLRKIDDWHEHDGVVLEGSEIDWSDLRELLRSGNSFHQAVSDDDLVRFGLYDSEGQFYLRFGFSNNDASPSTLGASAVFDFSAAADLCQSIKSVVAPAEVDVVAAAEFFDKRYAEASDP